jgi:spore maturation protein SpmA
MENSSAIPEQMTSACSGIVFATTAMAAVGCSIVTGSIMAMWLGTHSIGEQLTGFQTLISLMIPLLAGFIPVVLILLGRRKKHDHSCWHFSH